MAILSVPIAKAGNSTMDVDVDAIPQDVFAAIVMEGLKVLLSKKMSKITGLTKLEGDDLQKAHDAAKDIAQSNLADMMAGKIPGGRSRSAKKSGVPREVMTEAVRLAKAVVKDQIRAAGMKPSHVPAKDITAAANTLVSDNPSFIEEAKANLEARAKVTLPIDIKSMIHESPALIAKADAKKAKAKAEAKADGTISAKQAGKVAPRKGSAPNASM